MGEKEKKVWARKKRERGDENLMSHSHEIFVLRGDQKKGRRGEADERVRESRAEKTNEGRRRGGREGQ